MTLSPDPPIRLIRLSVVGMALATSGVLPVFLTGALAVQMAVELGFTTAGLGFAVAAFQLGSIGASAPLGRLTEAIGWSSAMRISAISSALMMAAIALVVGSLTALIACLLAAGAANALGQPAINLFLARTVPHKRQGLIFGVKQSSIPLAALIGGVSVPSLALRVGWEWVFVLTAVTALLAAIAVPRTDAPASTRAGTDRFSLDTTARRMLLRLTMAGALGHTAMGVLASFLVTYAVASGVEEGRAGLTLAMASVAGLVVRVGAGWLSDRQRRVRWGTIASLLVLGAIGLSLLAVGQPALIDIGAILAFGAGWGWPGLFNLAVVRHYHRAPAQATSITQIGVYMGNAIGPAAFGALAVFSFPLAWTISSLVALGAASTILSAGRKMGPA